MFPRVLKIYKLLNDTKKTRSFVNDDKERKKIQNYLDKENYSFVLYKKCYDNYSLLDYLSKLII